MQFCGIFRMGTLFPTPMHGLNLLLDPVRWFTCHPLPLPVGSTNFITLPAPLIVLTFTMEKDSLVLDGSSYSQRWGTVFLTFVGQSTMYLPLLVKNCAYVHRSTYILAYQSTISSIRFHILLFVFSRRCFKDVHSADDGIHIDVALLPICCCIVVVLWYFHN